MTTLEQNLRDAKAQAGEKLEAARQAFFLYPTVGNRMAVEKTIAANYAIMAAMVAAEDAGLL